MSIKLFRWQPTLSDEEKRGCGYAWRWRFKDVDKNIATNILKFLKKNERFYLPSWRRDFSLEKDYGAGDVAMVLVDDLTYVNRLVAPDAITHRLMTFADGIGQRRKLIHLTHNDGTGNVFEVIGNDRNILSVMWLIGDKSNYLRGTDINFCYETKLSEPDIRGNVSVEEFIDILRKWGLQFDEGR